MPQETVVMQKTRERAEIPVEDQWDLTPLYRSVEEWEADFKEWGRAEKTPHYPEIKNFIGQLDQGPEVLKKVLDLMFQIERHLSKLFTYAYLNHDVDVAQDLYKKMHSRISSLYFDFKQEIAWIEPELLHLPDQLLQQYLDSKLLADYRVYLKRVVRLKPHILATQQEELLALAGKPLQVSIRAFSALNNADLKFPSVENSKGEKLELTHGKYTLYLRSQDRKLREEAFKKLHRTYQGYENTITELLQGLVQCHVLEKEARHYPSCLEAALFPNEIEIDVYKSLIQKVRQHLPSLHNYMKLRKKALGYDEMHLYDLYVPLVPDVEMSFDFATAQDYVIESVSVLGKQYQSDLAKGLKVDKWVDRYENLRKRSGAYSGGCYDSMPYVLMNFQGNLYDLMTLSHELGHSMHSLLSQRHQPYQYSSYSIFLAEVASTFNEELMLQHLFAQNISKEEKTFLINQKLEDIRLTFFRQTMFAEFELKIHELSEKNIPLTPTLLKEEYRKLNKDYFGPDVVLDEEIDIEWARIPHFYNNFYVYQYATGISAAFALFERVKEKGEAARDAYLQFLSSGCSTDPLEVLKRAGVDMRSSEPVEATIRYFDKLVNELFK
ncbi:MAG TPA: oligoendopeptidase F [Rhabdochlamydiaceae bacterium]|nr:oligoendopeptidase F [Rhabdochlamydiaceae bacterium]